MSKLALFDAPAPPAATVEGQMAAHHGAQAETGLGDMALTGAALGMGGGALVSLLSSLRNRVTRPKNPYKPLYGGEPLAVPVAKEASPMLDSIGTGMTTDPLFGAKALGAVGVPLAGAFLLTHGLGKLREKQRRQDTANAIQGDYQKALGDYATAASGLKLAAEPSALDRLATTKTASPDLLNGFGLLGQGNPLAQGTTLAANVALPALALTGGYHLLKGLQRKKQLADDARKTRDSAVSDWRRKELFFRPPPLQATPDPLPTAV